LSRLINIKDKAKLKGLTYQQSLTPKYNYAVC